MGLAASQARLLSITARMHDVELEAQNIMHQKIALATQKDEIYTDYLNALDARKIQVATKDGSFIDATFANVCGYNNDRLGTYALTDMQTGKMVVNEDVYQNYKEFGNDKYAFALAMLGFTDADFSWEYNEDGTYNGSNCTGTMVGANSQAGFQATDASGTQPISLMTDVEQLIFNKYKNDGDLDSNVEKAYKNYEEVIANKDSTKNNIQEAITNFRDALYKAYGSEIYDMMRRSDKFDEKLGYTQGFAEEFPKDEFDYYVHLFEGIQEAGGCRSVEDFTDDGDTGNDWFNRMISTGQLMLNEYVATGTKKGWNEISVATSTKFEDVNDETNEKKAELEYQRELSKISTKETRYDQDLQNLETERTALNTELESIEKVRDDNVERTFGIFS